MNNHDRYDAAALERARSLYPKSGDERPYATTQPENICSAYRGARCSNGFPTNPGCIGKQYLPVCLDEDMCGNLYPKIGTPVVRSTPYHVNCPLCGAEPFHRCGTVTGHGSSPHSVRWKAAGIPKPSAQDRKAAWDALQNHRMEKILASGNVT